MTAKEPICRDPSRTPGVEALGRREPPDRGAPRASSIACASAGSAFPNDFRRDATAEELHRRLRRAHAPNGSEAHPIRVAVAGRMMFKRVMGKASFAKLKDRSGLIQLFLQSDALGVAYDEFKGWDVGDVLGGSRRALQDADRRAVGQGRQPAAAGRSRLRPLPDKWHGLADVEAALSPALRGPDRQRREPRGCSATRTRIVQYLRRFPRCARVSWKSRRRCCR